MKKRVIPALGSLLIYNEWKNKDVVKITFHSTTNITLFAITKQNAYSLFSKNLYDKKGQIELIKLSSGGNKINYKVREKAVNLLFINNENQDCELLLSLSYSNKFQRALYRAIGSLGISATSGAI